eukprot:PhF_6_TR26205/c0_g3_i1/m.37323
MYASDFGFKNLVLSDQTFGGAGPLTTYPARFLSCSFDPITTTCTAKFKCEKCGVSREGASMLFLFEDDFVFSVETTVSMKVSSGIKTISKSRVIEDEYSIRELSFTPVSPQNVFRGTPHLKIHTSLTPTTFESPLGSFDLTMIRDEGYILGPISSTSANEVNSNNFRTNHNVGVEFQFGIDATLLSVKRLQQQTPLQFVTSVLGTLSALAGVCVAIVMKLDKKSTIMRDRRERKYVKASGRPTGSYGSPKTDESTEGRKETQREMVAISRLLESKMTVGQARCIVAMFEEQAAQLERKDAEIKALQKLVNSTIGSCPDDESP